ncbi:MAG: sulfur carrier protein ThiS [Desulfuromonadaceae bacterium]|nr:sulfur carrier protein ThiS [Desulfuromonadaceae bacterium]
MRIVLNGENIETINGNSVAGLLTELGIGVERVAVEVNLDIVPKAEYGALVLTDGDKVEIVHFVGGG